MRKLAMIVALAGLNLGSCAIAEGLQIVDGDTLKLNGTTYRINGIDAPEHGQMCGDWACGKAATAKLAELTKGQQVRCDPVTIGRYGRTVATCYAGQTDLGAAMVQAGYAWAFVRYSTVYAPQEQTAKAARAGVWQGAYQPPWDYRARRWQVAEQTAPEGCPIKGNISRNGRIYHAPWSPWYSRTKVSTTKGERWFCTEREAIQAGWRAPRWGG
jgi:endonuclease YncB( thermonuclease family)